MGKKSRANQEGLAFQETEVLGCCLNGLVRVSLIEKVVSVQDLKEVKEFANSVDKRIVSAERTVSATRLPGMI